MTEINYPGVYVEEVPAGAPSIEGVPTSITAFAGWALHGPANRAEVVSSWADFETKFGGLDERSVLGYSVLHFFSNGGSKAYIVRLGAAHGAVLEPDQPQFEDALLPAAGAGGLYHLDDIEVFNLLCVPGETNKNTALALQKFCRERRAFLIVDCDQAATFNDLKNGPREIAGDDSMNAAFYFRWSLASDKLQNDSPREFPPCGFVAGIFARTDLTRGPFGD